MPARPGRIDPRIVRSRSSVLDAALAELAEKGYGAFTINGVAGRAGVARSTIYRLWDSRAALVADAIEMLNQQPPRRSLGEEAPRARITVLMHHLSDAMRESPVAACLPALVDGAERDPTLRRLHHHYNDRRRVALVTAIAAAVEAGEVRPGIEPELAAVALAGAVVYRRLMTSQPLRNDEVERLVETVLGP